MPGNEAKPHPLDFDALKKGDVIPSTVIEEITGKIAGSRNYVWALLQLRQRIRRERRDLVVRTKDQRDLVILSDDQAAQQVPSQAKQHIRGFLRATNDLACRIEPRLLTDGTRERHECNVVYYSWIAQNLRSTIRRAHKAVEDKRKPNGKKALPEPKK